MDSYTEIVECLAATRRGLEEARATTWDLLRKLTDAEQERDAVKRSLTETTVRAEKTEKLLADARRLWHAWRDRGSRAEAEVKRLQAGLSAAKPADYDAELRNRDAEIANLAAALVRAEKRWTDWQEAADASVSRCDDAMFECVQLRQALKKTQQELLAWEVLHSESEVAAQVARAEKAERERDEYKKLLDIERDNAVEREDEITQLMRAADKAEVAVRAADTLSARIAEVERERDEAIRRCSRMPDGSAMATENTGSVVDGTAALRIRLGILEAAMPEGYEFGALHRCIDACHDRMYENREISDAVHIAARVVNRLARLGSARVKGGE